MGGEDPPTVPVSLCLCRNWPCSSTSPFSQASITWESDRALRSGASVFSFLDKLLGTKKAPSLHFLNKAREASSPSTQLLWVLANLSCSLFLENQILSLSLLNLVIYPSLKILIVQVVEDITISKYVLRCNSLKDLNNATGSTPPFSMYTGKSRGGYQYWSWAQL